MLSQNMLEKLSLVVSTVQFLERIFWEKQSSEKSFSDWAVNEMRCGQKIVLFGDVFFSPLSLNRLCGYICHIIRNPVPGTFNLGSNNGLSKADFVVYLAKLLEESKSNFETGSIKDLDLSAPRPLDMRWIVPSLKARFKTAQFR